MGQEKPVPPTEPLNPSKLKQPQRYAPTTDGETVPGIRYEDMEAMMRTDVVDLSMGGPNKGYLTAWYRGNSFICYLPTTNHITIFEMSADQMRHQFIALLELGWVVDIMSEDFKDVIFHHVED